MNQFVLRYKITHMYQGMGWTIRASIPDIGFFWGGGNPKVETGSGVHPSFYSVGIGGSLPGSKVTGA